MIQVDIMIKCLKLFDIMNVEEGFNLTAPIIILLICGNNGVYNRLT